MTGKNKMKFIRQSSIEEKKPCPHFIKVSSVQEAPLSHNITTRSLSATPASHPLPWQRKDLCKLVDQSEEEKKILTCHHPSSGGSFSSSVCSESYPSRDDGQTREQTCLPTALGRLVYQGGGGWRGQRLVPRRQGVSEFTLKTLQFQFRP